MRAIDSAMLMLGVAAGAAGIHGSFRGADAAVSSVPAARGSVSGHVVAGPLTADSVAALLEVVVQRDPFRASRAPSRVELLDGEAPPPTSEVSVRPILRLVGIVGGPPWSALLEGIPGRDGTTLVAANDTTGGLLISAVDSVQVRVVGRDTSWVLTLARGPS